MKPIIKGKLPSSRDRARSLSPILKIKINLAKLIKRSKISKW